MTELGIRPQPHERLYRFPPAALVLDALAARADRQDSLERPHFSEGRLELPDQRALVLVGPLPVDEHAEGAAVLQDHKEEEQRN